MLRYLKLDPRTFKITKEQMFDISQCQFCGHTHHNFQRARNWRIPEVKWVQKCASCKKTISTVVSDENYLNTIG